MTKKSVRGWCSNCGGARLGAKWKGSREKCLCKVCGCELKPIGPEEEAMVDMQEWFTEVCKKDMNGPSPIQAAEELGCSRSMIDRLLERDVLEKSEFTFKDRKVVIISRRSVEKAKDNRKKTGNWTGHPVSRGA